MGGMCCYSTASEAPPGGGEEPARGRAGGLTASPETPPAKAASWSPVPTHATKEWVSRWGVPAEVRGQGGRQGHEAQPC